MLRRALAALLVLAASVVVVTYQVTRPDQEQSQRETWVPSSQFFTDFSPAYRTSIADVYYLLMLQYYGEHLTNQRLEAIPAMTDLVTDLSPRFTRPYTFGAFALVDAGRPDLGARLLEKGLKSNPGEWLFPSLRAFFAYQYGHGDEKNVEAARWYEMAAAVPGSPAYLPRLAAVMLAKGGEQEKAILMWGQVYAQGDKYSRQKAVEGLDLILPPEEQARVEAMAPLYGTMSESQLEQLTAELLGGHDQ